MPTRSCAISLLHDGAVLAIISNGDWVMFAGKSNGFCSTENRFMQQAVQARSCGAAFACCGGDLGITIRYSNGCVFWAGGAGWADAGGTSALAGVIPNLTGRPTCKTASTAEAGDKRTANAKRPSAVGRKRPRDGYT